MIVLITSIETVKANHPKNNDHIKIEIKNDSLRLAEIDRYWIELSRTVRDGDFQGYKNAYHEDAIVIFATKKNKVSIPLSKALAGWKQGFVDTKNGNVKSDVEFRFSQRIGDETTAHETGIFHYSSVDSAGNYIADQFVHFEMLLIKQDGSWVGMMEYQKTNATKEEWKAMKYNVNLFLE